MIFISINGDWYAWNLKWDMLPAATLHKPFLVLWSSSRLALTSGLWRQNYLDVNCPSPSLYISLRVSYILIDEQQCTVLRCSTSLISNVGWWNYTDEHVNFSPLRLTIIHIDSDGMIFMESFLQCGQHEGTILQGTKRPLKI